MKVVVNRCYGGFSVSKAVFDELGIEWDGYGYIENGHFDYNNPYGMEYRTNPKLIAAIEKIGCEAASGDYAELAIVEVPDDVKWYIDEYDGFETIREVHCTW